MSTETAYRQAPDALVRVVGADVLVATVRDREVHRLSGGAADTWFELEEARTLRELVGGLAASHHAAPEELAGDVTACIEQLLALGVIGAVDA